jgi:glycosyltransferase involved in cell wall biosynthesis
MNCSTISFPRVSVVTPAYNPDDLSGVVDSLNVQTLQDFEWVLVDDGSVAGSSKVFDAALERANFFVRFIRLDINVGQAEARNIGVRDAKGKFIKFLDADDSLDTLHLENLLKASENAFDSKVVYFSPTRHVFTRGGASFVNTAYNRAGETSDSQLVHLLTTPFLHHCGALFRRQFLLELGPYDSSLVTDEDGDLLIRVLRAGYRFEPVPSSNYIYIHHDSNGRVSRDDTIAKLKARRQVCDKLIESYLQNGETIPADILRAICTRLDKIVVTNWATYRNFCEELLAQTEGLVPGYPRSGSMPERVVRRLLGIGASMHTITTFRIVRGWVARKSL